jgi:glutamyl-tRNA reductase
MEIILVGLSHRTAPVEVLEKVTVAPERFGEVLQDLLGATGLAEAVILHTCNRSEYYAAAEDPDGDLLKLTAFVKGMNAGLGEDLEPRLYKVRGGRAVRHLMSVASSLDSMVLGETQIQSQVKDALQRAAGVEAAGPLMQRLFSDALSAGKRVRAETAIGALTVSVSSTAVELARKIFGVLERHSALIVGAGETAQLTTTHLHAEGVHPMFVASRTFERAHALAKRLSGEAIPFDEVGDALCKADIALVSTSAPHYILRRDQIARAMRDRRNRPLFIIDISVPRNVDPEIDDLYNVYLYNIDDLEAIAAENRRRRAKAMEKANALVEEDAMAFERWQESLEVPTLVSLRRKVEGLRAKEEEKVLSRLSHLDDGDKLVIRKFANSLVNKILHDPSIHLKESADPRRRTRLVESVRFLFKLDASEDSNGAGDSKGGADSETTDDE